MWIRLGLLLIPLLSLYPRAAEKLSVFPSSASPALPVATPDRPEDTNALRADGYRGIWFTLGQFSEHGDKYSGGLGTYTANHVPLAVYSPKANKGWLHLFTKYTKGRGLYFETSPDGRAWSPDRQLAGFGGHYQVSGQRDGRVGTLFNYHPAGNVDKRCNLYYVQTDDGGTTWTTADRRPVELPLSEVNNPALVLESESEGVLTYTCDLNFDDAGRPLLLYVTSRGHQPGPENAPREFRLTRWDGRAWQTHVVAPTDHNYDMGSLYVARDQWSVIAPTLPGPQPYGGGGELCLLTSTDEGWTWAMGRQVTRDSPRNHNYARRPVNACDPFVAFWADGDPGEFSDSHLYFSDAGGGRVGRLPYHMDAAWARPLDEPRSRGRESAPQSSVNAGSLRRLTSAATAPQFMASGQVQEERDASPAAGAGVPAGVIVVSGPVWERHVIDQTSSGADGVKLGDLDSDGRLDLVTGWEEGGEVRAYLRPAPEDVRKPWPRVTVGKVSDPEDAIFADLDGDGRLEVVSCTEGNTRTVFWHRFRGGLDAVLEAERWSATAFPATRGAQMWMQAIALDLDGRHGSDLVVASKGPGATIGWLEAPSRPEDVEAWRFHPLRDAGWIMSLIAQDLDGDGDADVVFTDRKGGSAGVFWLENPGAGANREHAPWAEHAIGGLGREVMFADVADVNRDGRPEVVVAVKPAEILILSNHPAGGWHEEVVRLDAARLGDAKAVKVADVNRDGWPDLLFSCENARGEREGVIWLEQRRPGPWRQHPLGGPAGTKFDLLEVLDLDEDGDLDLITCEETEGLGLLWYENPASQGAPFTRGTDLIEVRRLPNNPIIRPDMLPGTDGENINGPSLIRVPPWVASPLGRYYLYFAHHNGKHIRLAYADDLAGPWKVHAPGVLHLTNTPACRGHLASPDVVVDETRQEIRMYFHGPARAVPGQKSFVALSRDGLHFAPREEVLGLFYFRVFPHAGAWFALAKGGVLYRSRDGLTGFERGHNPFPGGERRTGDLNEPGPRHVALHREDQTLWVYYSNIGDAPERILRARIDLTADWREWQATNPAEVLRPEFAWEGVELPIRVSAAGAAKGREHALRDPAIFVDAGGRVYLLYSVAGESGIAIAELVARKP